MPIAICSAAAATMLAGPSVRMHVRRGSFSVSISIASTRWLAAGSPCLDGSVLLQMTRACLSVYRLQGRKVSDRCGMASRRTSCGAVGTRSSCSSSWSSTGRSRTTSTRSLDQLQPRPAQRRTAEQHRPAQRSVAELSWEGGWLAGWVLCFMAKFC